MAKLENITMMEMQRAAMILRKYTHTPLDTRTRNYRLIIRGAMLRVAATEQADQALSELKEEAPEFYDAYMREFDNVTESIKQYTKRKEVQ